MKVVTVLALAAIVLALVLVVPVMAASYTVDGDLSDWGITPVELNRGLNDSSIAGQSGDPDAWAPDSDTADWIVEDNKDPDTPSQGSHPGYGVHIKGTGSSYSIYDEPLVHLYPPSCSEMHPEPFSGEAYDVEAMYFDDDEYYAYFAIVVSSETYLGDFYLEVNGEEYGIVLQDRAGLYQGQIYKDPDWIPSDYVCEVDKTWINASAPGTYVGMADVVISDTGISDFGYTNYVVEIRVRKTLIGCPENCTFSDISYACSCGNDHIENEVHYDYPCIPEFLTVAIPAGMVIGLVYIWKRRQRK